MLGINFIKLGPTTWVIHYKDGKIKREGRGLSFFYYAPNSVVVAIPIGTADLPFVFTEVTSDYQTVTIQGQLTYRIATPGSVAELLDFSVDASGRYRTEDPDRLGQRLVNQAQSVSAAWLDSIPLRDAVRAANEAGAAILAGLRASDAVAMLGVEPLSVSVISVAPTPEMGRALEAEARESLQRDADGAIYARRNYAVEQERRIRESELSTEIAVEQKRAQIRETQMGADIAVEQQRRELIDLQSENERKAADTKAYAIEAVLRPVSGVDWRILATLVGGSPDARTIIADAFERLAENAEKVGILNISPELLEALTSSRAPRE